MVVLVLIVTVVKAKVPASGVTGDGAHGFSILNFAVMVEAGAKMAVLIVVEVRGVVGDGGGGC